MSMKKFMYLIISLIFPLILAREYDRKSEGSPVGLWAECPRSERFSDISPRNLKHLRFVVQRGEYRKGYNYFQAVNGLLSDPMLDLFNKKTLIYISGYMDSAEFLISKSVNALADIKDYNSISIDTNRFTTMFYTVASRLTRPVGRRIAEVLVNLTRAGVNPKNIELVGLSLGCHTAGYIGKHFYKLTGEKIARITGLDPAGPCFRTLPSDDRLAETDADFVDAIHTNIDGMGSATPVGRVDFYVNGGEYQPGGMEWFPCDLFCSHLRSLWVWMAAVNNPKKFIAFKCDSIQQARDSQCYDNKPMVTNLLGPYTDFSKPGIYYLATSNTSPFYLGKNGLLKEYNAWKLFGKSYNNEKRLLYKK